MPTRIEKTLREPIGRLGAFADRSFTLTIVVVGFAFLLVAFKGYAADFLSLQRFLRFADMAGGSEVWLPERFALKLQMADGAKEGAGGGVGGVFVLNAAGCPFVFEEGSHVCHDNSLGRL